MSGWGWPICRCTKRGKRTEYEGTVVRVAEDKQIEFQERMWLRRPFSEWKATANLFGGSRRSPTLSTASKNPLSLHLFDRTFRHQVWANHWASSSQSSQSRWGSKWSRSPSIACANFPNITSPCFTLGLQSFNLSIFDPTSRHYRSPSTSLATRSLKLPSLYDRWICYSGG